MKKKRGKFLLFVACCWLLVAGLMAAEPLLVAGGSSPNTIASPEPRVTSIAIIPCSGMIDDGLYQSIKRRTQIALDGGATYIIYEISTYGGLVQSADDIAKYFIHDVAKKADTVAYITTEAISAGAMISVSCKDIIMRTNTTIGDCAPIEMGGKLEGVEREKAESFIRAAFERAAEANKYPKPLLRAMVSQRIEVWRVKKLTTESTEGTEKKIRHGLTQIDTDVKKSEALSSKSETSTNDQNSNAQNNYEFFETDQLPKDANQYDLANKELIDSKDDLLTLTASKALEYGIARTVVADRAAALAFLETRDNVLFSQTPTVLETNWSEEMVRILNHPVATSLLFMIGLLGIYIELGSPGLGLPGLVAVICFAILFGSRYLVGLANWVEVVLFVVGILLLLVELLIVPGFGVTGILGIIFIIAGLLGMFIPNRPDELPWPKTSFDWTLLQNGALTLGAGFVGFLALAMLLAKHLPKIKFLSGLVMMPAAAGGVDSPISMTAPPETAITLYIGQTGEVITPLRPSGKAQFDSVFVDVVAQGEFLKKGTRVRIVEISGNRVVVAAVKE